jgi:copper homeostasis protein (lipoprotein)
MRRSIAVIVLGIVGLTPPAMAREQAPGHDAATLGSLPASYAGDLPCADCQGIRYRLNLFPDGAFFLGMTYLGKGDGAPSDDIGTWMLSSNRRVIVLKGGRDAPTLFRIVDAKTLRKLDLEGREIASALNYSIVRTDRFERLEPRLSMRGMFRYMADAGSFTECSTGQRWPVAHEGDNAALEREYVKTRKEPGGPVMVSVDGRVAMRPRMEGEGLQPTLVVDRFIATAPGGACAPRPAPAPLDGTSWRLTRLGDTAVVSKDPEGGPDLTFDAAAKRASGFGGCNRIMGSFARTGLDGLTIGQMAGTMMACADGMETEAAFSKALARVKRFNILGSILELHDEAGKLVARFEARPAARAK